MDTPPFPWPDPHFEDNRAKIPFEAHLPYNKMHIAYSWDGTRILDGDPEEANLLAKLDAAGVDTNRVVLSYFEYSDTSYIGPLCDFDTAQ
jgi:hypothetical protein